MKLGESLEAPQNLPFACDRLPFLNITDDNTEWPIRVASQFTARPE